MQVSPKLSSIKDCPCGSEKLFVNCCARFLIQQQQAKTPEQLMRSRFCAYFLGGFGDYLLETWFPPTAKNLTAIELSKKDTDWQSLELLNKSQQGNEGVVEFKAYFLQDQQHKVLHETSIFSRVDGRWFYIGGEVSYESSNV